MNRSIAELNIQHSKKLLLTDLDDVKRATVERLLAVEETKLARLTTDRR